MKVLVINPWAVNNDQLYASGFIEGMNRHIMVDFATNYYYKGVIPNNKLYRLYFRLSEKMAPGVFRTVTRGIEYICNWLRVLKIIRRTNYDVVHFHWLLRYKIDVKFLKIARKKSPKMVLTAHNVLPHKNSEEYVEIHRKIYEIFDRIIVHGNEIKKEFIHYFPEYENKLRIHPHGYIKQSTEFHIDEECKSVSLICGNYEKIFIMYGRHFFNKGTDRLLKIWRQNFSSKNCLLIIAGGIPANYYELHEEISKGLPDNIYLIDHYLNDNLLNYCLYLADAVILPYRHASMTGVVFTAAAFQKPLLATDVGSIREYLSPNTDSFLCENSDGELMKCIDDLIETPSDILKEMGKQFSNNIEKRFSWETITEDTFYDTYLDN